MTLMRQQRRIHLEHLEGRVTPAAFGYPWPDARRLTISFVPDGTLLGPSWDDATGATQNAAPSRLFASQLVPAATWQREILRAFQTWAVRANVDLVVVPDSGEPLGTPGAPQGDPRFGDVRVAAGTLSQAAVATSVPYTKLAGTWAGDLLFNTRYSVGVGPAAAFDLFTLALHEAGHVFGIAGNRTNPDSVMYEYYPGVRGGLGAAEVNAIQSLYRAREPDRFEDENGNDTIGQATSLRRAARSALRSTLNEAGEDAEYDSGGTLAVTADLTTATDVDVFQYRTTRNTPGFTV